MMSVSGKEMGAVASGRLSKFQQRVYALVRKVPAGKVTTYKMLAEALGMRCPRAIGQALRRNPFAPEVPCHRVIASDLRIGGFSGEITGAMISKKIELLRQEGVIFADGRLVDQDRLFAPRE